jgi:hypothetical protein
MKYLCLFENFQPDENLKFLKLHPNAKSEWLDISDNLVKKSELWEDNNHTPRDKETVRFWMQKNIEDFPEIIVHYYGDKISIIDGWHRLAAAIKKGEYKIKVLSE